MRISPGQITCLQGILRNITGDLSDQSLWMCQGNFAEILTGSAQLPDSRISSPR